MNYAQQHNHELLCRLIARLFMFCQVTAILCLYFIAEMVDEVVDSSAYPACGKSQPYEDFVASFLVTERYILGLNWLSEVVCAPRQNLVGKKVLYLDNI